MKFNKLFLLIFFISLVSKVFAQDQLVVTGDSLVGKRINGKMIREVTGNVVITQDDVKITCRKAIQYLSNNEAELLGNVVVTRDTITLTTEKGYYYGNDKIAYSDTGVTMDDGHINLSAVNGYYYFDDEKAYFFDDVVLIDSVKTLYSDRLRFFHKDDLAQAAGNVFVTDTSASIFADSLLNYKKSGITYAFNNLQIKNESNGVNIFGEELFDDPDNHYSRITGEPLLMQIDTLDSGEIDTLLLNCKTMESFSGPKNILTASDSVKIWRGAFSSVNDRSVFYRDEDRIQTVRPEEKTQPILWFEDSQLSGDSIDIYLEDNYLKWINIVGNAFILSRQKSFDFRFNQISGDTLKLFFDEKSIERTEVYGNVLSIYYLFEENEPNGLIKSSSEVAKIRFDSSKVVGVNLYGSVESEFHPENLVEGNEKDFTLPAFVVYENRPAKRELLTEKKIELLLTNEIKQQRLLNIHKLTR